MELLEINGQKRASAKLIHEALGLDKTNFSQWIKRVLLNKPFIEDVDFSYLKTKSTGGRPSIDYLLSQTTAISVIMMSGGVKAHEIRLEVVKAFEEKQSGVSLSIEQVKALTEMVKAMTLVSVQNKAEKMHFNFYGKPRTWWTYRAELLGYSTESLKNALININKKYTSQKKALIHIDPSELIRTGVIDLLISLGRSEEYALNIGEWAKAISEVNGYYLQIWDDTKPNPLGLKLSEIIERQVIASKYIK